MKKRRTPHPLRTWATNNGLKLGFLAAQAGISARTLATYLNDGGAPLVVRNAFETVTGGDVRADNWPEASA